MAGATHKVNAGFTMLARLRPDRVETTRQLLADLHDAAPERLPFSRSTTTHFATITILPAQRYRDQPLPATLLLATSFCGPARAHVKELVAVLGDGLRAVLEHCEGFVVDCAPGEIEAFLLEHRHSDTFYSGMHGLSPGDVRDQERLRVAIEAFVDERQEAGDFVDQPLAIREAIVRHVKSKPELAWALESYAPPRVAWWVRHWRSLIVGAIALPIVLAIVVGSIGWVATRHSALGTIALLGWIPLLVVVALLGGLLVVIRHAEIEQTYVSGRQPDMHVRRLAATQNRPVINEFTIAGPIKEEGFLRPLVLRLAMWIVARAAEGVPWLPQFRKGIDIPTVATARWIACDRGRRLVFISNYTHAAEPYVRDFIDIRNGAKRINLTFGFGRGYPQTRWIVEDGALADPNAFIHVVTENQRPTAFWYGPYRHLSIDNIKRNQKIREGVYGDLDEKQTQEWLHLL